MLPSTTRWTATSGPIRRPVPLALLALSLCLSACSPPPASSGAEPTATPRPHDPEPDDPTESGGRAPLAPPSVTRDPTPRPRSLGPAVSIEPAGGLLRGTARITATARGARSIAEMRFIEPITLAKVEAHVELAEEGRAATLVADFPTTGLADGPLTIAVEAVDAAGHATVAHADFTTANHGPAIVWNSPAEGALARGGLVIEAEALDPDGVGRFGLVGDDWPDLDPAPERVRFEVDTAEWPDGRRQIELRAVDTHGNHRVRRRTIIVDNRPTRHITGSAWAGGPVIGGRVRALSFGAEGFDGRRLDTCPPAGCLTDENGGFALALVDGSDGPLRIRVDAAPDEGTVSFDPLTHGLAGWPADGSLSALLPFPTAEPVSVHPVTTLLDWTVVGHVRRGADFAQAFPLARTLWGEHACDHCLPSTVEPVGAGRHPALSPAVRLGLMHGGLAELALWRAHNARVFQRDPQAGFWSLMTLLRRDLTDGVLDGTTRLGQTVGAPVDPHTLRRDLGAAIERLLAREPDWLDVPRAALRGQAGWLETIADRRSPLWRAEPAPLPLDVTPPTIRFVQPIADSAHGPQPVEVHVEGEDDGAPPELYLVTDERVRVEALETAPGRLSARLDVRDMPEGPLTVQILAEDAAGHLAEDRLTFSIDHTAPSISFATLEAAPFEEDAAQFTRNAAFVFRVFSNDPAARVATDLPSDVRPFGEGFVVTLRGYGPGRQPVTVRAEDPAGNITERTFDLHWIADGPGIEIEVPYFTPAGAEERSPVDCRVMPGAPAGPLVCDLEFGRDRYPMWDRPDGATLIADDDREPPETRVYALPRHMWHAPWARITVRDATGRALLEWRHQDADGRWTDWAALAHRDGVTSVELDRPFADGRRDRSSIENVQVRAIDGLGSITVRHLRWRRAVVAPPLHVVEFEGYAERDSAVTPGGYGFGPDRRPVSSLVGPDAEDGVQLARWRVYNPWALPSGVRFNGGVTMEHWRSRGYRVDGVLARRDFDCDPGAYFVGGVDGEQTSGCAASPWALVPTGERLLGRQRHVYGYMYRQPDGRFVPLPEEGLTIPPRSHVDIYLRPTLPDFQFLPNHEVEVLDGGYLFHNSEALNARLRLVPVERDSRLSWSVGQVNFTTQVLDDPEGLGFGGRFPARDIELVNPPLQLPAGLEAR